MDGKRDGFITPLDFRACARAASMKRGRAEAILAEVRDAVRQWPAFTGESRRPGDAARKIAAAQRRDLAG